MFHLFNYAFLKFDYSYDFDNKGIVISADKGGVIDPTVLSNTAGLLGNINPIVGAYEELVGSGKTYETDIEFFQSIFTESSDDNKYYIYCDTSTYLKLLIKFLRLILPNITALSAYHIYNLNMKNLLVHFVYLDQFELGSVKSDEVKQKYKDLAVLSYDDFEALFDATLLTGTLTDSKLDTLKNKVSLEYLLVTYLCNNTTPFKDQLEAVYKKLYYNLLELTIDESRKFILKNIYQLDTFYPDITITSQIPQTVEDIISQDDSLSFVLDEDLTADKLETTDSTYLTTVLDTCKSIQEHFNIANISSDVDCKEFELARDNNNNVTLELILAADKALEFDIRLFVSSTDTKRYNYYLVTKLYKLSEGSVDDQELMKYFCLEPYSDITVNGSPL